MALLAVPSAATAQSAAEWRERHRRATAYAESLRVETIGDEYSRVRRRTGRIVAGERRVRFDPMELSAQDTSRLATGLRRGAERLRATLGAAGVRLIDDDLWDVFPKHTDERSTGIGSWFTRIDLVLATSTHGDRPRLALTVPIDPDRVADFVVGRAGATLVERTPALHGYEGWTALLTAEEPYWSEVPRRLAISWAAAGRRCATGATAACADVLAPFDPTDALARLFDPSDHRTLVAVGRLPALTDSIFFASRRRCLDGADSACARIVGEVEVPDPFGADLRGTLLTHAFELGGSEAMARIASAPADAALPLLARVAGIPEDSLIASWQRRTSTALDRERGTGAGLAVSTAAWSALLLLLVALRKPA